MNARQRNVPISVLHVQSGMFKYRMAFRYGTELEQVTHIKDCVGAIGGEDLDYE